MRLILMIGLCVLCVPYAEAQVQLDVTNMFRSLSGSLRSKEVQPPKQEGATPVLGVRGIDETDQARVAAPVEGEDYVLMEGWGATRLEASATAAAKGLVTRPAKLAGAKP